MLTDPSKTTLPHLLLAQWWAWPADAEGVRDPVDVFEPGPDQRDLQADGLDALLDS